MTTTMTTSSVTRVTTRVGRTKTSPAAMPGTGARTRQQKTFAGRNSNNIYSALGRRGHATAMSASAGGGDAPNLETASSDSLPPRGFGSISGNDGVDEERSTVPESVQDDYRKIEDPTWLERELLRADDGYPTSRTAVMIQAASTGDIKGFSYAVSSVKTAVTLLASAYVAAAAARVGAEEGDVLNTVGATWGWFLLAGLASAATEVTKFIESVIGVEGRRKM